MDPRDEQGKIWKNGELVAWPGRFVFIRIQLSDAIYQTTPRGNARQRIFRGEHS